MFEWNIRVRDEHRKTKSHGRRKTSSNVSTPPSSKPSVKWLFVFIQQVVFFLYFSGKIFHWHWIVHIYKVPILEFKIISDLANPATAARQNGIIHIFLPWGLRIDSYLESLSLPKLPFWLAFIMKLPPILPALMQNLPFAVFRLLRKCFYNSDDVASGHNGTGNKRDSLHKHTFL